MEIASKMLDGDLPAPSAVCHFDAVGKDIVFNGFDGDATQFDLSLSYSLSKLLRVGDSFLTTPFIDNEKYVFSKLTEEHILSEPQNTGNPNYVYKFKVIDDPLKHLKGVAAGWPSTPEGRFFKSISTNAPKYEFT